MRIWAKVMVEDKIIRQSVLEKEERYVPHNMYRYLAELCEKLDVPTPILLKSHILQYAKFRHVKFLPRDFADTVEFDKLWIENID